MLEPEKGYQSAQQLGMGLFASALFPGQFPTYTE